MRHKLTEFVYYVFWVLTTLASAVSIHPLFGPLVCACNALVLVLYIWICDGPHEGAILLKPMVYAIMLCGMAASVLVTKTVNYCIIAGPVFLAYLHLEGGYRNGTSAGQSA